MQPLTPEDVIAAFATQNIAINITFFASTTATSQQAADEIGCELGQIVKSICFMINGSPVIVLTSGDQLVDDRKLAVMFDVGRKKVKTAKPDECVGVFGYPPGSVPPLGHRTANIPTCIDTSLQRYDLLYAAGGAHNAIFPITLAQLQRATGGQLADVVKD